MTVSSALATAYSNQKKAYTFSNGDTIEVVQDTGTNAKFLKRTSAGVVTDFGADIAGWVNGSIAAYVDSPGAIERLVAAWRQSGTGGSRTDGALYAMVGTFDSGRTTLTWGAAVSLTTFDYNYPDIVTVAEGMGGKAFVVASNNTSGPANFAAYWQITIDASGVAANNSSTGVFLGNGSGYGVNLPTFPSIDVDPVTKRLFAAWSAGTTGSGKGIRFRTASYSAGTWTWATEVEIDTTMYIGSSYRWLKCVWDDARSKVVVGGLVNTAALADRMMAWDSTSFTSFANRVDTTDTTSMVPSGSMAIDSASGDVYFVGQGYGYNNQQYVLATRVGTGFNLGSAVQIDGFVSGANLYTYAWFASGKVRLLYTRGNNSPYQVVYYEFAPPTHTTQNFGMHVGSFTKATATGNQDIPLPTGCPDLTAAAAGTWAIQFWQSNYGAVAAGTWASHATMGIGFVANGGGTISQFSVVSTMTDAVGTSDTARRMAAKAITHVNGAGNLSSEADFVSFPTSTTMRINWSSQGDAQAGSVNFIIYTGLTNAKVVNWTTPTAVGSKAVTGAGFRPDLVLHATTANASLGSTTTAHLGFGAMNKHGQQWANVATSAEAQVGASNTSRWQQTDASLLILTAGESPNYEARFSSMDLDGFTTYFSLAQSAALQMISLCLGGVSSKLGAFVAAGTSQTITSRHGFTPRGALFSTFSDAPTSAPRTHAVWSLGAYDGTSNRGAALIDEDALATTKTKALWSSTGTPAVYTLSGPAAATMAGSSWATDSFSVTYDTASGATIEYLYILVGDSGTSTFPVKIDTNTQPTSTAYGNQRKATTLSTGRMVAYINNADAWFYWSDDGQTWTYYGTSIPGFVNGSIAAYVDSGGTERLVATYQSAISIYLRVGTFDSGRTTLSWSSAIQVDAGAYTEHLPDLVVMPYLTGARALVGNWRLTGATGYYVTAQVNISATGVPTFANFVSNGVTSGSGVTTDGCVSLDINPVNGTAHMVAGYPATGVGKGIRYTPLTFSGGNWTVGTEVEVDNTVYSYSADTGGPICRWDGTRVVIGSGALYDGTTFYRKIWDSTTFTAFTNRVSTASTSGVDRLYQGSMVVDPATGYVYLFGANGAGVNSLVGYKFTRSGSTLTTGSLVQYDAAGAPDPGLYVNAWYSGGAIRWVYTAGNNSPYTVKYDRLVLGNLWTQLLAAVLTPAGVHALRGKRLLAGAFAPAASALIRAGIGRTGVLTSSGADNRKALSQRSGSISPSSEVSRTIRVLKDVVLTSLGISTKKYPIAKDGTIAGSGALAPKPQKALIAALDVASALARRVLYLVSGEVFFSPDETNVVRVYIYSAVDTVGNLARKSTRYVIGAVGSVGGIAKKALLPRTGSVSSSAGILRKIGKVESGSADPISGMARKVRTARVGAIGPGASQTRKTGKLTSETMTPISVVSRRTRRSYDGALITDGATYKRAPRPLAAALTMAAGSRSKALKRLAGALTSAGLVRKFLGLGREWAQTQPDLEGEPFGGTTGDVTAVDRSYTAPEPGQTQGQTRSRWG